jgi:phosphatidylglycerol:prolipoprotein diacylglycerol transferase
MLAIIKIGIDPVAFRIGSLSVHWYGILYVVAFIAAYQFAARPYMLKRGATLDQVERLTGWAILFGLIGARLYYDVQTLSAMRTPLDWIAVWNGGMAFYGAIVAATATILFLGWRWHLPLWSVVDAGALFAAAGQPIGRIGNIINGDILGGPSNLPWATAYTNPSAVLQSTAQVHYSLCVAGSCPAYQPAGAYEGLAALVILAVLLLLRRRGVRPGVLFITYFALYAVSQFGLDFVRESEPIVWLGMKELQLTAIVAFVIGMPALLLLWRRSAGPRPAAALTTPAAADEEPAAALETVAGPPATHAVFPGRAGEGTRVPAGEGTEPAS